MLTTMGYDLHDLFGKEEAEIAAKLIAAAADKSAKAVAGDIEAHRKVWEAKDENERKTEREAAALWAVRRSGHRVDCPACGSTALLFGDPVSAPQLKLKDDEITETQEYLPTHFECVACGLKINGLSRLNAADWVAGSSVPACMMPQSTTRLKKRILTLKTTIMSDSR